MARTLEEKQRRKRILLGQLGAKGDCLYATAIARQIKTDDPECHLTWAISSMCREILSGNPHVDEIWEITAENHGEVFQAWQQFEGEALERKKRGDFDEVFLTQITPNNLQNYDGTVRYSIFRAYPKPIKVSVAPVIRLSASEIENVRHFAEIHSLGNKAHVILFEYASRSGQSFVTPELALEVAQSLVSKIPDVCMILSSDIPIQPNDARIVDGSILTFRENAELTKYCSLLVGCSSGISWLCTSDWAKPLPMIQLLKKGTSVYASFVHDYEYRGEATDSIIEMTDCSADRIVQCITTVINEEFSNAKLIFHERIALNFDGYCGILFYKLLRNGEYKKAFLSIIHIVQRYGFQPQILTNLLANFFRWIIKITVNNKNKILKQFCKNYSSQFHED